MTSLSPAGQKLVEEYLARLRQSLSGCSESEKDDIAAEARSHVEEAVSRIREDEAAAVSTVLRSLGEPEQYAASLRGESASKTRERQERRTFWRTAQNVCVVVVALEVVVAVAGAVLWHMTSTIETVVPRPERITAPPAKATAPNAGSPATTSPTRVSEDASLGQEAALVVRAVKGELTDDERAKLPGDHPALAIQLADPNTKVLLDLFAGLPEESRARLLKEGYLKWKYASLDPTRQEVYRKAVRLNLEMAQHQGAPADPTMSLTELAKAEVGFAAIEIPDAKTMVISWYVLFPHRSAPLWVTLVGAQSAGTGPYFQAHLHELPLLRQKPESALPE